MIHRKLKIGQHEPTKIYGWGDRQLMCTGRVGSSCSTGDIRLVKTTIITRNVL